MSNTGKSVEQIRELHRRFVAQCADAAREATSPHVSLLRKLRDVVGTSTSRFSARLSAFFS